MTVSPRSCSAGCGARERTATGAPSEAGRRGGSTRWRERAAGEGLADVELRIRRLALRAAAGRRHTARASCAWRSPRRAWTRVLERLAQRLSPRIVESSAPLEPLRRELEEYFAGSRRSFELALDWSLIGPFGQRVLGRHLRDPLRRRAQLRGGRRRGRQPARLARGRQRAGLQPDPDRDPLPPRAAQRRRARRLRRRARPQALAARARGRAGAAS